MSLATVSYGMVAQNLIWAEGIFILVMQRPLFSMTISHIVPLTED